MNFTAYQMQIATLIDDEVIEILQKGGTAEETDIAIIGMMSDYAVGFRHLLDTLEPGGMNILCEDLPGFFRFAKMMERIAGGCRDGLFDDIISKQKNT